jgi:nucleoside-diphosphate-sugar epimerase
MKVFVAGAAGAIGRRLVPLLVAHGHEVTAMTRSHTNTGLLRAFGAEPVWADGLDAEEVMRAVGRSRPEVVIHEMSGLAGIKGLRNFDREFALTNRLRTEGVDHLLAAAYMVGARRFIAQSFGNWNYERTGSPTKTEDDRLDRHPPAAQRRSLAALRDLEATVVNADGITGIALRYGNFYGPGTSFAADGDIATMLRKRAFPIIGDGAGVWSFVHVDDAATATLAALERGDAGVYNVADDDPAPVAEWLPELARRLGAPAPRRVPVWLGRIAAGEVGVSLMTQIRGASNAKARRELGWAPRYASWREGFADGLGDAPLSAAA